MSARKEEITSNLAEVRKNIATIDTSNKVCLVAVSKYKPVEDLMYAYEAGQRHFGENYVQELVDKSQQLPKDIQWHFIGHLQSNKCRSVAGIPNLYAVETIDSSKKADTLNKACVSVGRTEPLGVYVQVNTSQENAKSGVDLNGVVDVCRHIVEKCGGLRLYGLMTIGMFGRDPSVPNPDFKCLMECKYKVEKELNMNSLQVSMGMSSDYVEAIKEGSTNVRVGTTIFGGRPPKA